MILCVRCEAQTEDEQACDGCGAPPLVDGRYRLLEVLGRGANATTYRAQRLDDDAIVALKELLVRDAESLKTLELFEREASILEQLDHPGIPAYHEDLTTPLGPHVGIYLAQDFVDGVPLSKRLEEGPMTAGEVVKVIREVAEILIYLHDLQPPVVHRDIKPGNLIQRPDGRVVLVDFGSVKDAAGSRSGDAPTIAGTLGYMAPEQLRGEASPASDVYGLGATAVALLAGRSTEQVLVDRESRWGEDLPLPLRRLLKRMLAGHSVNRPTPRELLEFATAKGALIPQREPRTAALAAYDVALPRPLPVNFDHSTESMIVVFVSLAIVLGGPLLALAFLFGSSNPYFGLSMLIIATVIFALVWRDYRKGRRRTKLFTYGTAVCGRIEAIGHTVSAPGPDATPSLRIHYSFEVSGARLRGDELLLNARIDDFAVGDEVVIFHDPRDPESHLPLPALLDDYAS